MTDAYGQEAVRLTAALHAERDTEFLALAAAGDRSAALPATAIAVAVAVAVGRSGTDFVATAHGRAQRAIIEQLGQGGWRRQVELVGTAGGGLAGAGADGLRCGASLAAER